MYASRIGLPGRGTWFRLFLVLTAVVLAGACRNDECSEDNTDCGYSPPE